MLEYSIGSLTCAFASKLGPVPQRASSTRRQFLAADITARIERTQVLSGLIGNYRRAA